MCGGCYHARRSVSNEWSVVGGQWEATGRGRGRLILVIPRPATGLPEGRPRNPHDHRLPVDTVPAVICHRWHRGFLAPPLRSGPRNDMNSGIPQTDAFHRPPSTVTHGPLTARSGASRVGRAQCAGGPYHASRLAAGAGGLGRSCLDIWRGPGSGSDVRPSWQPSPGWLSRPRPTRRSPSRRRRAPSRGRSSIRPERLFPAPWSAPRASG